MSAGTKIQWCDATVNFWWGCTKVSGGCAHCYAETLAKRLGRGRATWGPGGARWLRIGEACQELLRLDRIAAKKKKRLRIFINSMSDTFEDRRDLDSARRILFGMAPCVPHLDLLLLTKRPQNIEPLTPFHWTDGKWPGNVWLGTSVEDQGTAWRLREIARYPAPVRFASIEPMLGALELDNIDLGDGANRFDALRGFLHIDGRNEPIETLKLDWIIVGGESGLRARVFNITQLRALMASVREFQIPVFVKQLGRRPIIENWPRCERESENFGRISDVDLKDGHGSDMAEWPADLRVRDFPQRPAAIGVPA